MKPKFFTLSLILTYAFTCSVTKADDVILARHYIGEKSILDFKVPIEELRKVRPWSPLVGDKPPLSRNQALAIAQKAAMSGGIVVPDLSELVISLERTNIFEETLVKRLPQNCCCWFYMIDLRGRSMKLKSKYTFLVSMSGFVAVKQLNPGR